MAIAIGILVLALIFNVSKFAAYLFVRITNGDYKNFDVLERNILLPFTGLLLLQVAFVAGYFSYHIANCIGVAILGGS